MGRTCERMREMRNSYKNLVGKSEWKRRVERTRRMWITLRWSSRKQDMTVWSGLIWLGVMTNRTL